MSTTATAAAAAAAQFHVKRSGNRGHADHDWLKTYHHFPFASYYDPSEQFQDFGALRVINEDRVEAGTGFGTHGHSEFEIFSYIVDGELEHRDSLNNLEIMKRASTGTGIRHSEYNRNTQKQVHFLQIWAKPYQRQLPPKYYNRHFSDEEKLNTIVRVVAPPSDEGVIDEREAEGPIPVHADIRVAASILQPGKSVSHTARSDTTKLLVHNIMRSGYRSPKQSAISGSSALSVKAGDEGPHAELQEGDSLFITGKLADALTFQSNGGKDAEFLIFEML